jgi:peroxiredoxin
MVPGVFRSSLARRLHVCRRRIDRPGLHADEPGSSAGDVERPTRQAGGAGVLPAAFSSVCAKELCTFRDSFAKLGQAHAQVYGISVDTFFTLKAFHDHEKLSFPLLSDFNKQVIREYGVFNEDMIGLKGIAKRAVFVIDKDGVVRHREVLDDARNEPDYNKVFSALATLAR